MKMENNIVTHRKVEVLRKDNMEEESLFIEDEEALEEVMLDLMPVENQGTSLGNVPREIKEEERHTLLKHISMWKNKHQKEEIKS
jgi:hypothetical protein